MGPLKLMELWDEAQEHHIAGRYAEAEAIYDNILTQNQKNAGLLATMGTLYLQTEQLGKAIMFLTRSVELMKNEKRADVMSNLALAYKYAGHHDMAEQWFKKSVESNPSAAALANYGSLYIEAGTPHQAIEIYDKALALDPQLEHAHWNMSMSLLELGKWDRAWDAYEWGLKQGSRIDRKIADAPYWDGTKGKTVAVYGEQGIGDEIMFASMIPDLMKDANVIFECHTRLKTLFENSFGVKCYGTREDADIKWPENHKIDYRISIGSLGKFYRRSKEAFPGTPYLKTTPLPKGDKFRVGISWTGGRVAKRVRLRTVPLSWWKSILNVPNVEFVSLQYTDCAEEIKLVEKEGYSIRQFGEVTEFDYNETAKLVASCDLVISVCTSVIHLAGALGVPCWVMTPSRPAWRYGYEGPMPWYRSVRLYRQPKGDVETWIPVIQKIGLDLDDLVASQRRIIRLDDMRRVA